MHDPRERKKEPRRTVKQWPQRAQCSLGREAKVGTARAGSKLEKVGVKTRAWHCADDTVLTGPTFPGPSGTTSPRDP